VRAFLTAYPGGRPGVALLLLRATLGIALLLQGALCVTSPGIASVVRACTEMAGGVLLTIGFFTPFAALLLAVGGSAFEVFFSGVCGSGPFNSAGAIVFAAAILTALVLLGPGAFSVDAKMFGRREIIIPPRPDKLPR
jgi:uncharacterized membrane protein YphA (DoxX/SURF4 family)